MTSPLARRLIVLHACIEASVDLVILLPGGPSFTSTAGFLFGVVLAAILMWLLWNRSRVAWISLMLGSLSTLGLGLLGVPLDASTTAMMILAVAEILVLAAPPMLTFVWSRRQPVVAASPTPA